MKCRLNWRATVAAVLAIFTTAAVAGQDQKAAERSIVERISAGADAAPLIGQYLQTNPSLGSPRQDHAATLRQLQAAEANLADALKAWKGKGNADAAAGAYREWQAAMLLMQARHRTIESKLSDSADGSAYLGAQRNVSDSLKSRRDQVVKLLDPLLGAKTADDKTTGKSVAKDAAKDAAKSVADALALLQAEGPKKQRDTVLHALNLPVGGLNLATRTPVLTPVVNPAYATLTDAASAPDDTTAAPEGALSQEIIGKATELGNDYVRIYEYVRNNTKTTWYAGAVQGAAGTLRSGSGNDVDQAALLVALLRAASLPTRYVHGVIELPLEKVAQDMGLQDASLVPAALTKAGVAFTSVARGGKLAAVNVEHTWVAARVPYTNYRGAMVDASGKTWIPLDPSFKANSWPRSQLSLADLGGAAALQNAYMAKPGSESFAEFVKRSGTDALQARTGAAADYAAAIGQQSVTPLNLSLLPNSLPYNVVAVTSEEAQLGAAYIVKARIKLASGGRSLLATDVPLYQALNERLSLTYLPASLEDHRLSLLMGGMDAVPLYLIKLRPQLGLGGHPLASANEGLSAGSELQLDVEFTGPFGSQRVSQTLTTGGNQVLLMAGNAITRPATKDVGDTESDAMRLMDGVGVAYTRAWIAGEDELAALAGARALRAAPSLTIVTDRFDTVYHGETPFTMEWQGVTMDALAHPVDAAGNGARDFLQLSGLHGSSLESALFGRQFSVDAVSADQLIAQAKAKNVALLRVDNTNLGQIDATSHSAAVKESVRNLARLGYRIEIPVSPLTLAAWSGSGWRAIDSASGASGYFLSGGLHGGATASAPQTWTLSFLADILAAQNGRAASYDVGTVRKLLKLGGTDGQTGTVGQQLDQPLTVVALDGNGVPVEGAAVRFNVVAGGGTVGGGKSTLVLTNRAGMAAVALTLGKSTSDNPRYVNINPGDKAPTRVSKHVVDAVAISDAGEILIDAPFDATANPDKLARLERLGTEVTEGGAAGWVDTVQLQVGDQYGNPLPNIEVSARMDSTRVCNSDRAAELFKPGAVFDASIGTGGNRCGSKTPMLGDCGQSSTSMTTVSDGAAFVGVILSNDVMGQNLVTASAGGITQTMRYKAWGSCPGNLQKSSIVYGGVTVSGAVRDVNGNNISAALPNNEFKNPIEAAVTRADFPYDLTNVGGELYLKVHPFINLYRADGSVNFQVSNGGASTGASQIGKGTYQTSIYVGPQPGANNVVATASGIQVEIPQIINNVFTKKIDYLTATSPSLKIFSVKPSITEVVPRNGEGNIELDVYNHSAKPLVMQYAAAPAEYSTANAELDLYENNTWVGALFGPLAGGKGDALIPRGQVFEVGKNYEAELILNRGTKVELRSERYKLPTKPRLITYLRAGSPTLEVDEVDKRVCDINGLTQFGFNAAVVAKLEVQPLDADGKPNGIKRTLFDNKAYAAGDFDLAVEAGLIGSGDFEMTLSVASAENPNQTDIAKAGFNSLFQRKNALPVGQVLVHGVKVRDGTLTMQPYPVAEPGRGPSLRFQPTYSSAGYNQLGSMGMNWSHNWETSLHINSCGDVIVSGGDSGSVVFFPDDKGGLVPAKGYHSTLVRDGEDFDFFSKDGTQYHYSYIDNRNVKAERNTWKLMWVKDSNGNTLTLTYDMMARPSPLLKTVTSVDGRMLKFDYVEAQVNRLGRLESRQLVNAVNGPGLSMAFKYDDFGNLILASGNGRSEAFDYDVEAQEPRKRNLMIGYTDPNGRKTAYEYKPYELPLTLPSTGIPFVMPQTVVSKVVTPTGPLLFEYEIGTFSKTTVTNQNGNATKYELNPYGSPLTIMDGAGLTTMTWALDDIYMLTKTDPRGVTTTFDYDEAGNMTSESVAGKAIKRRYMIQDKRPYIKDRLLGETDRNKHTTGYIRDEKGNLLAVQHPDGGQTTNSYSGAGDLLASTDPRGGTTKYSYDGKGNMNGVIDPMGATTSMVLNERGRVTSKTNARGATTTFEVDQLDRVKSRTDASGGVRTYTYDAVGNKLSEKDEEGRTTTWEYSAHDHPVSENRADGSSKTMGYDGVGNKTSESDYRGNVTTFNYDGANRLTSRTEPMGRGTTYGYDGVGHVTSEKDGLGRTTTHTYDDLGSRISTTDAAGGGWSMDRDGVGNLLSTTDPEGRTTSNVYDAMNRLVSVIRPVGSLSYGYDKNGNRTSETDGRGNTTTHDYDAANRLIKTTDANGKQTVNEYDTVGNLTKVIDPNLNVTLISYDELDRKQDHKDGEGYRTVYHYDRVGNLTGEDEPNGNAIGHTYDKLNRRISSFDSLGKLGAWDHDADGNLLSETDADGNVTTHEYNALSQLKATYQPEGRDLGFEVDLMGNRTSLTDGRGNKTDYVYDKLNRVTSSKDAKSGTHIFDYDKVGNKTKQTDPLGHSTSTQYDGLNRPILVTDALSQVLKFEYDENGNKTKETDKRGIATTHIYDKLNRLTSTARDGLQILKQEYDSNGNVMFATDANNTTTSFTYDRRNLRTSENRLLAAITKFDLDSMGDVSKVTDPEGRVTVNVHDARRRLISVTNGAGETTKYDFDGVGHPTRVTHPLGNAVTSTYDAAGRLKTVSDAVGTHTYGYDKADNHVSYLDALSHETRFDYDELNRRTKVSYPDGVSETFGYDAASNITSHTDGNGTVITRTFDVINRETNKHFSASDDGFTDIGTGYDANNNVTTVDQKGSTTRASSFTFDRFDRQLTHTDAFGAKVTSTYDANGNKLSILTQDGQVTRYGYDVLNRLTSVVGKSGVTNYSYDRSSLETRIEYGNGVASVYNYDKASRVSSVLHQKGSSNLSRTEYEYDSNGNRKKETINRIAGAQVTTYDYDTVDRLTRTVVTTATKSAATDYGLDAMANRLSETVTTTVGNGVPTVSKRTETYGVRNELTTIDDGSPVTTLNYDGEGNLIEKKQGSDSTIYRYNGNDNLISVARNGTVLGRYSNDYLGLRIEKEAKDPLQPGAPPVKLRTLWDGRNAFQDRDTDGAIVARYDNDGRHPVGMWHRDDGSQALHRDALGSIVATTDSTGKLKSEIIYDAFGNITEATGQSANKFGYTGHQMDAETGLVYFQARYYDPQLGRFITQDPYEGDWQTPLSLHHYLYAYANPTTYIDRDGHCAEPITFVLCAGLAALITTEASIIHEEVTQGSSLKQAASNPKHYVRGAIAGGVALTGGAIAVEAAPIVTAISTDGLVAGTLQTLPQSTALVTNVLVPEAGVIYAGSKALPGAAAVAGGGGRVAPAAAAARQVSAAELRAVREAELRTAQIATQAARKEVAVKVAPSPPRASGAKGSDAITTSEARSGGAVQSTAQSAGRAHVEQGTATATASRMTPLGTYRDANGKLKDQRTNRFVTDPESAAARGELTPVEQLRRKQQKAFENQRKTTLERDDVCVYCQKQKATEQDHFRSVQWARKQVDAGLWTEEQAAQFLASPGNLVGSCGGTGGCNPSKSGKTPTLLEPDTEHWRPSDPTPEIKARIEKLDKELR